MAYADLTQAQKDVLDSWLNEVRGLSGNQVKVMDVMVNIDDAYNANVSAILQLLLAGDEIPNASGLDGAAPLTQQEVINLVAYYQTLLTNNNSAAQRQQLTKASGVAATI